MTTSLSDEIAFLVFRLRSTRLTLREQAIYYNHIRLSPPVHTLETRLESLVIELRHLRKNL